ncbi:MAG: heterodisulfide reductase-related iron-sulfur binding cluster [Chloroflexota bacterium]
MTGAVPGREVFEGFAPWMEAIFYAATAVSLAICGFGIFLRWRKYARGRVQADLAGMWRGLGRAVADTGSQTTIGKRHAGVGFAHAGVFWGFIALFIGTSIITVDYDIVRNIDKALRFWRGDFYLGYKLSLNIMGAAFVVGLLALMVRRGVLRPAELDYTRVDREVGRYNRSAYTLGDWVFVSWLLAIGISGFLVSGLRIRMDGYPPFEVWAPIEWGLAWLFGVSGMSAATAHGVHMGLWWFHGLAALGFIAFIPYSKAMHMLADVPNLALRDPRAGRSLPPEPQEAVAPGYSRVRDLTPRQLLSLDACTKCGRCHHACPARASGGPLSPRDLILDLREHADMSLGVNARLGWSGGLRAAGLDGAAEVTSISGDVIPSETLWACTTCLACVEACPVGIEHVTLIVQMRRNLVDRGEMEPNLRATLVKISQQGNSFGLSARQRGRWTQGLPFEVKDARKTPVEYLWFVGDYASFDPRLQEITRQTATIFHAAGLDFGILYEGERNSGNDVRRVGEEGLFEVLATQNLASLAKCRFETIVTTDPHSFNTLKNEYGALGGSYAVWHYSELLERLLEQGKLPLAEPLSGQATYHDPCYLGRYNGVYDAPRSVIRSLGLRLVEMPRSRANSFCCGAGGGRIWMDDSHLKERPSESRIREAMALGGVGTFVVACPKDVTMYRDAVKTVGVEGQLVVKDLAELVFEALARPQAGPSTEPAGMVSA